MHVSLLCMRACMHASMQTAYFCSIATNILKTYAHLKMNEFRLFKFFSRFYIGTLVVVHKRAIIEDQTRMRLVVAKDIILKDLATREVFGQKQYLPAYWQNHVFFERTSGKNPVTGCLESIKAQIVNLFDGLPAIFS